MSDAAMNDEAAIPVMTYRDHLLATVERWERQRDLPLPGAGRRRAGEVAAWIRRLVNDADMPHEAKGLIPQLQHAVGKLGNKLAKTKQELGDQIAKTERELRDTALDRDRWRKRAHEAEALLKSSGATPRADDNNRRRFRHDTNREVSSATAQ
jgi:hypothetical protein